MSDHHEHDEAWVRELMGELVDPPGPFDGAEARARARRRGFRPSLAVAALLLLGLSVAIALPLLQDDLRARGERGAAISLDLLVEELDVRRTSDRRITPGQRVIFRVHPSRAGWVCLDEASEHGWERLLPAGGGWWLEAGRHLAESGGEVQAFRTDRGPGARAYRALLDPDDPACGDPVAEALLELEWLP